MKATKQIFDQADELYKSTIMLKEKGILAENDDTGTYKALADLMEKYDFDNEIFTAEDGRQGVKWCWGSVMIPAIYDKVKNFVRNGIPSDECSAVVSSDGYELLVLPGGNVTLMRAEQPNSPSAPDIPIMFKSGDKWGIGCSNGNIIDLTNYDNATPAGNGRYIVEKDGKKYFVTPECQIIVSE